MLPSKILEVRTSTYFGERHNSIYNDLPGKLGEKKQGVEEGIWHVFLCKRNNAHIYYINVYKCISISLRSIHIIQVAFKQLHSW